LPSNNDKKKGRRWFIWLLGSIAVVFLTTAIFMGSAGIWLSTDDDLVSSDAIVVLAGRLNERAEYASDLYHKGYAPVIFISRPEREKTFKLPEKYGIHYLYAEEVNRKVLLARGVPPERIKFLGNGSISTAEEAQYISQVFGSKNKKIIIITSPFHVRRARMILNDIISKCDIRVVGTPYSSFKQRWWPDQGSAREVILEICKI
jgi:uncharacterized SAM-binding protein YcdF (DUF218 family)